MAKIRLKIKNSLGEFNGDFDSEITIRELRLKIQKESNMPSSTFAQYHLIEINGEGSRALNDDKTLEHEMVREGSILALERNQK
jgi:hypothetical protein